MDKMSGRTILEDIGHIFLEKISEHEYILHRRFPWGLGWTKETFTNEQKAREAYKQELKDDAELSQR